MPVRPTSAAPGWADLSRRAYRDHETVTRSRGNFSPVAYQPTGRPSDEVHRGGDSRAPRDDVGDTGERSAWHWLLWLPVVLPLITPVYNRIEPRWFGVPFFYWFQLAFVGLDIAVITLVYQATKRRTWP